MSSVRPTQPPPSAMMLEASQPSRMEASVPPWKRAAQSAAACDHVSVDTKRWKQMLEGEGKEPSRHATAVAEEGRSEGDEENATAAEPAAGRK